MSARKENASLASLPPKPTPAPQGAATAPQAPTVVLDPNAFVNASQGSSMPSLGVAPIEAEEPTQRLTLDIPLSLHVEIKSGCARRRTKIREEVLALLEAHYRPRA